MTENIENVLAKHREQLLKTPGCTGIGIAYKEIRGKTTDTLSIVIYVEKKTNDLPDELKIPRELDGILTDVIERKFNFQLTRTDPHAQYDQLFSGIAITNYDVPASYGTIGCFIYTGGKLNPPIAAGNYLLTNDHVARANIPGPDPRILQPNFTGTTHPPVNYIIGNYVHGIRDSQHDCAIVQLNANGRTYVNEIPNPPMTYGRRELKGIYTQSILNLIGKKVYKFGAGTNYSEGTITNVDFSDPASNIQHAFIIENLDRHEWVGGGDSGSVVVLNEGNFKDYVVALNFRMDTDIHHSLGPDTAWVGLAYNITTQLAAFADNPNTIRLY